MSSGDQIILGRAIALLVFSLWTTYLWNLLLEDKSSNKAVVFGGIAFSCLMVSGLIGSCN